MRSRSTTPSLSDSSSGASALMSPWDSVDHLATAMDSVNLSSPIPDDEGYEIVVLPLSPASAHSDPTLFSVLSIPSSHDAELGSDSESSSSFDSSEEELYKSAPVAHSGIAQVISPSAVSSHRPALGTVAHSGIAHVVTPPAALSHHTAVGAVVAHSGIAHVVPPFEASSHHTTGKSLSHKVQSPAPIKNGHQAAVSTTATATSVLGLSKGQRQRRYRAARKAAAQADRPGSQSPSNPHARDSKAQKQATHALCKATSVTSGSSRCSSSSQLSKSQRQKRNRAAINAASVAVNAGTSTIPAALDPFNAVQRQMLLGLIFETASKSPSAPSTSGAPGVGPSGPNLSKNQRLKRNRVAIDAAAKGAVSGALSLPEASANFNAVQRKKVYDHILEAFGCGAPSDSASCAPSSQVLPKSHVRIGDPTVDRRHDHSDATDHSDANSFASSDGSGSDSDKGVGTQSASDDSGSESGYSTDCTLSASDAASAINS